MASQGAESSKSNDKQKGKILGYLIKRPNGEQKFKKKKAQIPDGGPTSLPVAKYRNEFFRLINENKSLLIVGETGSGKTTKIPTWCVHYCKGKTDNLAVACTQPRRIAAMSIATRVAKELNVTLGQEVGYSVRFESCCSDKTSLKYLTDGMLLREAMLDGMLSSYGVIVLDEAHERTLQTEILFGVVKRAMLARSSSEQKLPPLKVVVMSATMNVKLFKRFLDCPLLSIEGRQHPVQDMFTEVPQSDLLTSTLTAVFQIHRTTDDGDILVFCCGQEEITSLVTLCKKILKQAPESLQNLTPLPLYASLPAENQLKVFDYKAPATTNGVGSSSSSSSINQSHTNTPDKIFAPKLASRRVIFATNVAETSITIPNIKYVIDTGKVKCRTYCPKTGLESLRVTNISKAQAKQRSGRAGRIAPGNCYRLYTSDEYSQMSEHLPPEIKRSNLDSVILQMISIGISDVGKFEFLERPDGVRLCAALASLKTLKAIRVVDDKRVVSTSKQENSASNQATNIGNDNKNAKIPDEEDESQNLSYELTDLGKKLCLFPLDPKLSRIIIAADELGCLDDALTAISLLYVENLFHIPPNRQSQADQMLQKFSSNEGDIIMLLKAFKAFKRTSVLNKAGLKQWCIEHFINVKNLKLARMIRKQLADLCKSAGMKPSSCGQDTSILRKAFTYGWYNNVATMWNGKYRNKTCNDIYIHPSSCLFRSKPECVMYFEIVETQKCYMRNCTLIDMNWIREISTSNLQK